MTQELDQSLVEAFAGRMLGIVNDGMLALMVSVGHRTGLFDAMARTGRLTRRRSPRPPGSRSATSASGSAR